MRPSVLALFFAVAALDLATGSKLSLHSAFVVPVGLAAWTSGRAAGLPLAVLAATIVAYIDVESALAPTFIVSDGVSRVVSFGIVAELAARVRRARIRTEETAARLQGVLDAATEVAIMGCDPRGVLTTFNVGAEKLLGYRASEVLGRAENPLMASSEVEPLLAQAREGVAEMHDWIAPRKDGERRTLRMIVTPKRKSTGRLEGYLCVAFDVTEQRRAEEAIAAKNAELQAFAYTVSHDLKAPLRGIAGYAQELQREHAASLSERATFCLDQIQRSGENLNQLIDDLLKYSRLVREDIVLQDVDIEVAVREVLNDQRPVLDELGTRVEVDLEVKTLRTWERGFLQILGNLVDNAVKYSRRSHPPIVRITTRPHAPGGVELSVSDNGIGFDPKYAERIFGLFSRLAQPPEYAGTGAGLAIVQRVVDKVGAVVHATSSPGNGATFVVDFPPRELP